jgi:hypothetical protein
MDLGAFVRSGGGYGEPLFAIFKPINSTIDIKITGKSGLKYICDIGTGEWGEPSLGCHLNYQNSIHARIELKDTKEVLDLYAKGSRSSKLNSGFSPDQVNTFLYEVKNNLSPTK